MHGYNYTEERDRMWERFDSGKEEAYFAQFGGYCVENAMAYEQLLRCGYTHEQAMAFDSNDRIKTTYGNDYREVEVARTAGAWCVIRTLQLPNGKWVAGFGYSHRSAGGATCNPSIYCRQFDTEREAKCAEIRYVIGCIGDDWDDLPKELLPPLKRALMDCRELSFFD